MLCTQNVSNIYRKTALSALHKNWKCATSDCTESAPAEQPDGITNEECLHVFEEAIDFTLEASVPDPVPFSEKLVSMLEKHEKFIPQLEQETADGVLKEVGRYELWTSAATLDTEQVLMLNLVR